MNSKFDKTKAFDFYTAWLKIVSLKKEILLKVWRFPTAYTDQIISTDNSVIIQVSNELGLLCYTTNYYSLDTILYKEGDKVSNASGSWFHDIRVAFEHENYFNSGLYQEISHLLITNCDLRVLVTYPPNDSNENNELDKLHKIVSNNRNAEEISNNESLLLIFGYESDFKWEGKVYKTNEWKSLNNNY